MLRRAALLLFVAIGTSGCVTYEFEHEFWLRVDGSGTVYVTGQPALWETFKALPSAAGGDEDALRASARALFERSGLRVRRVTVTHRRGRPYLFVSADFSDVGALPGTPAFPDLAIRLARGPDRLELGGQWAKPPGTPAAATPEGLVAVRFHLPSKVLAHRNAVGGVERGNILGWREDVAAAVAGRGLDFGATLDARSILWSTVGLFAGAIVVAGALIVGVLGLVARRGRRAS